LLAGTLNYAEIRPSIAASYFVRPTGSRKLSRDVDSVSNQLPRKVSASFTGDKPDESFDDGFDEAEFLEVAETIPETIPEIISATTPAAQSLPDSMDLTIRPETRRRRQQELQEDLETEDLIFITSRPKRKKTSEEQHNQQVDVLAQFKSCVEFV
jgi:hypothetical protein